MVASTSVKLDCGHEPTATEGCGTGYARMRDTNETLCYDCADARQVTDLLTKDNVLAYVSSDGKLVTTWTGGRLGRIVAFWGGSGRYTPSGGWYRTYYVNAIDVHGQKWYGRGSGKGMAIRLRKAVL